MVGLSHFSIKQANEENVKTICAWIKIPTEMWKGNYFLKFQRSRPKLQLQGDWVLRRSFKTSFDHSHTSLVKRNEGDNTKECERCISILLDGILRVLHFILWTFLKWNEYLFVILTRCKEYGTTQMLYS